ncbi:MAG TPA: WhiB family transcriptional regulator [Acidimicrobiaceae bacterium]|nr:WhiB family transcriptional regulator [Acidimicrobiaceae bacterium]
MSAQPSYLSWQSVGACRGPQVTVFFPPSQFERKHDRLEREERAKAICAECSVTAECLEYALAIREPHGVWGGLSESERRARLEGTLVAVSS